MPDLDPRLPWLQPAWRADADTWIAARLAERDIRLTGPIEQFRARPWSTVMRVPTSAGLLYFKQPLAAEGYEAALTGWLAGRYPDALPAVLVADPKTHRLLLADAGLPLGDVAGVGEYLGHWHMALSHCARVQVATAEHVGDLLAMGVPDRRLAALPGLYRDVLDSEEAVLRARPEGLSLEEMARLRALEPRLRARCERLAGIAIPETVQHNDLHDSNVFVRRGQAVLADWADACVGHPFTMLGETLHTIVERRGLDRNDPALAGLCYTYLRPFRQFADDTTLQAAVQLAAPLGLLCGILTAHLIAMHIEPEVRHDMMGFEVEWFRRFALWMADM